ncbi:hypothetical protein, conserved [Trypanosoma brucei gambiense DAL972]|uniref:Uncharacterized protein n=2 Tax=Trypanosoma brucei TaxID=5691 RepID=C9ZT43_TRYB9|nr:hypothetical protein, conserved [Trypanosoma brucei gambiense DAL972]RHW71156.1 hypothetical protein DPX39_070053800 [Trypanosoma brucei equiperdum]CBH12578.1 hypothetical protein, conserved [Trypanosoma brucei gambiense DAL972]|eukprot:XP_011774858.1 hypothetical protein, conserved [Trypanosoma brucei gambiense DAL972]
MGFFKKRYGVMRAADKSGRHFIWTIKDFCKYGPGTTLDSANVTCFTQVKFHLHIAITEKGNIGVYMHYKSVAIPKYSYYFVNSDGAYMRQHTAHTIPPTAERCGHWNTCHQNDMLDFVCSDGTIILHLHFDDDVITLEHQKLPSAGIGTLNVTWSIPRFFQQVLNPFTSGGFVLSRNLIFIRLEAKRETGTTDVVGVYNVDDVKEFVLFALGRNGIVPPHSLKLLDEKGGCIAELPMSAEGGTRTIVISKEKVLKAIGRTGTLRVFFQLQDVGNPLDALNFLSCAAQQRHAGSGEGDSSLEEPLEMVRVGNKKETYVVMDERHEQHRLAT